MLHTKMFISNAVQEIIKTNKNGKFAGDLEIKLPLIPEARRRTYHRRSQLLRAV